MKKLLTFLLCLMMVFPLAACDGETIHNEKKDNMQDNQSQDIRDGGGQQGSDDSNGESDDDSALKIPVDYSKVLTTCRRIVDSYPIVNQNPRAVAAELGIRDEEEIQIFIDLYSSVLVFYPGRGEEDRESPHYKLGCGYAQKDLNGDGVDELVLMNKDYYVMADFSYADGNPVLIGNYRERNSCWIDGDGLLHINGSSGADYSVNAVYKIADGGKEPELIAEYGTNGHEWIDDVAYTKYYKLINNEKVSITENEYHSLADQYGKYLGSVAGSEVTKQYSGLTFASLYTEAEIALEMYEVAINDEICVFDERLGEIKLKACRCASNNWRLDESIIDGKAILDMDGDGICEYIILSASMDNIILHYFDGKVYSYSFYFRNLYNFKDDGSYTWNHTGSNFEYGESSCILKGQSAKPRSFGASSMTVSPMPNIILTASRSRTRSF